MTTVTIFSQRDPNWAGKILGTGEPTIGQVGCLLTCAASMLVDLGVGTDPGRLNDWLIKTHGYVDDNLFLFDAIEPFGAKLVQFQMCERTPAPVGVLSAHVEAGRHVILLVDFQPGGKVQPHWVRLLNITNDAIMDPWQTDGKPHPLSTYFAPGWTPERAIMGYVAYVKPKEAARVIAHAESGGAAQAELCFYVQE